MKKGKVLVADDDEGMRVLLRETLEGEYEVETAGSGLQVINLLKTEPFDLILLDLKLPDLDGIGVLREIRDLAVDIAVIIITGYASVESAVEAMKLGAYDYLKKPFGTQEISLAVKKAMEKRALVDENIELHRELEGKYGFDSILGTSKAMQEVFKLIEKIAPLKTTVLIHGESGTGKELVARAIHYNSPRKKARFVPINCGGIPETLLESELFGHRKGAFTGAYAGKRGIFQVADQGTIFLDEIGNSPYSIQVKLLRVLEESRFIPLGGTQEIEVDVRVIAASNTELETLVKEKRFREDLFYRLNVVRIVLPPLRERREDVPLLVHHFLEEKKVKKISAQAMKILEDYSWPGNVRELENAIEHASAMAEGDVIGPEDLPSSLFRLETDEDSSLHSLPLKGAKEAFEKRYITEVLKRSKGNVAAAAKKAGIARQNFYQKLKKYGLKGAQ